MQKKFGVIIGRFQPLHLGHQLTIDCALEQCERVAVFVASAQAYNSKHNPFTYDFRKELLRQVYGDRIEIYPLNDLGACSDREWGDYVLKKIYENCNAEPDGMFFGNDNERLEWFDKETADRIEQIEIDRQSVPVSATKLRQALKENNFLEWSKYVDGKLYDYYNIERNVITNAEEKEELYEYGKN